MDSEPDLTLPEEANRDARLRTAKWHMCHTIVQQVIGDIDYVGANRDDECWWQLQALEEQNALPPGLTAVELYNLYRTNYGGEI